MTVLDVRPQDETWSTGHAVNILYGELEERLAISR